VQGLATALSVGVSGNSLAYQWYQGPVGNTSTPVPGATGADLTVSPPSTATYWVEARNACGVVRSSAATVTVVMACDSAIYQLTMWNECGQVTSALWTAYSQSRCVTPTITSLSPMDQTITPGDAASITATANANTPITYQWYEALLSTLSWSPIANSNVSTITVSPIQDMWYRVVASTECGTATQDAPIVRVVQP
jgi:hypothetical protein